LPAAKLLVCFLLRIGYDKQNSSSQMDLSTNYSEFIRYFQQNVAQSVTKSKKTGAKVPDRIPIPLFFAYMDEPFRKVDKSTIVITKVESKVTVS
jgi:hypothetical protein